MSWVYLFIAGLLEIGWAIGLKQSDGFTKPLPSILTIVLMIASFGFLSIAVRELPIGTAYAVWTGIGAVGVAAVGIIFLHEPAGFWRVACIGLVAIGIVGLKLLSK